MTIMRSIALFLFKTYEPIRDLCSFSFPLPPSALVLKCSETAIKLDTFDKVKGLQTLIIAETFIFALKEAVENGNAL